jgi:hypothetical protein
MCLLAAAAKREPYREIDSHVRFHTCNRRCHATPLQIDRSSCSPQRLQRTASPLSADNGLLRTMVGMAARARAMSYSFEHRK